MLARHAALAVGETAAYAHNQSHGNMAPWASRRQVGIMLFKSPLISLYHACERYLEWG